MEILALVFLLEISGADGYNVMYQPDSKYNGETYEMTGYIELGVTAEWILNGLVFDRV